MYIDINSFADFFKGIGGSISVSAIAFWNDVLVPLWVNFTGWIESFTLVQNFCTMAHEPVNNPVQMAIYEQDLFFCPPSPYLRDFPRFVYV